MAEEYVGRKFKTVFIGGDAPEESVVEEIIAAGERLNDLGLTPGNAGNISVRTGRGMLITVGGVNKGELSKDDVVEVVDFDFRTANVVGRREPSSEVPMHWLIYQSYPMANAVVHVHDMNAVRNAGKLKLALGVHSTEKPSNYGTQDQAFQVINALEHSQYAVIREHGIVCMGQNLGEALDLVVRVNEKLH
jgi:L-fuculose-phosphate aldolase